MGRRDHEWKLPPAIEARLGETSYGRQRAMLESGHLLIVLHTAPGPDGDRDEWVFLRKPEGTYAWNGNEYGERRLHVLLSAYEERYEHYERAHAEARTARELFPILRALGPLCRAASNLRRALQSAREMVPEDKLLIAMRDRAYELSQSLDLLLSEARMELDFRMAENAEDQALQGQAMATAQHKLNVLAAITFPLLAVATIFGMNLAHGLESLSPGWFWVVFVSGTGLGLATLRWVTRHRRKHADRSAP